MRVRVGDWIQLPRAKTIWRERRDSNPRPPPWQGGALTSWATPPHLWQSDGSINKIYGYANFFHFSKKYYNLAHETEKKWFSWELLKKRLASYLWLDQCAGGICIRERKGNREILCVLHKDGGVMLPKWRIRQWETRENAALREFQEETGIYNSILGSKIGVIRDRIRRKKVTLYWIHENQGKHTPIHDEAIIWVCLEESPKKMKHASERDFILKYLL